MRRIVLAGWAILVACGCDGGPPRGEVEGVLTVDGEPLPNVLVTFLPSEEQATGSERATGLTDESGQFRLRAEPSGDPSIVAGGYRVILEDMAVYDAPRSPDGTVSRMPRDRFPAVYRDPLRTPLRESIHEGPQTVKLEPGSQPRRGS